MRYSVRQWQEFVTFSECLDLALTEQDATFFAWTMLGRILPSVRSRYEIRANIAGALRGERSTWADLVPVMSRNWSINQGAHVASNPHQFNGHVDEESHYKYASHLWWCHRTNKEYIRRFLTLAQRHKIRVYWLLPPIAPELQARREQTGVNASHTEFVQAMQSRYPNLTVLDGRQTQYAASRFVDPVHLDGDGAAILSADLAGILRQDLASPGSRWIALPSYHDRPIGIELESIEDSRLALQRDHVVRH